MWKSIIPIFLVMVLSACNLNAPATETPTATYTETQTATTAATVQAIDTATVTSTASNTPTPSHTPTVTFTPGNTATPSITPAPDIILRADQLDVLEIPDFLRNGLSSPVVVFANSNDQTTITNVATGEAQNTQQIVYVTSPGSQQRTSILELESAEGNRFYPAENGTALAYFLPNVNPGLYILNLRPVEEATFSARLWQTTTLVQRGILSEPVWTSDGEALAVTQQTGYALDIFLYSRDTRERVNLTNSPSYDMFPAFSPDGRFMAFVSDRATCPSWNPADDNFCDALTQSPPTGGTVHLLNLETGEVRQLLDEFVTEAPRWINNNRLVIAAGDQNDLLNPQRNLWLADVITNEVVRVQLPGDDDSVQYLSDVWSPDGETVIFQRATISSTEIVMMTVDGDVIDRRSDDLTFPRYSVRMDWSATGDRIAIGGTGGRCPFGVRVADTAFDWVATGNAPVMCNPVYSPDGQNLAFTGITSDVDGRLDIYSATENGFGQFNLTANLRGSNILIGWMGS